MSIYSEFIRHSTDAGLLLVENMMERMASSVGGHIMNLANMDHRLYIKNRLPNNFRIHMVYMAPSGYTKSTYYQFMLRNTYGLLFNREMIFPTDVHSSFSVASWLGTMKENKETGEWEASNGVMETYKRGIIGADDYQALTLLLNGEGIGEDERALMTALDTDEAVKNLATGQIRIKNVGVTCWFGMRPCKVNLRSGLARRLMFPIYFPTRNESKILSDMAWDEIRPSEDLEDETSEPPLLDAMTKAYDTIVETGPVNLDFDSVKDKLDKWNISHFELKLYKAMAVGWSVANGTYPDIKLDPTGLAMIEDELACRELLRQDPYRMMFYRILDGEKGKKMKLDSLKAYMTNNLQFDEQDATWIIHKEKGSKRLKYEGDVGEQFVSSTWKPQYLEKIRR